MKTLVGCLLVCLVCILIIVSAACAAPRADAPTSVGMTTTLNLPVALRVA